MQKIQTKKMKPEQYETTLNKNYELTCPNCDSTFDVTKEMDNWKLGLIDATDLMKEIKEIVKHE